MKKLLIILTLFIFSCDEELVVDRTAPTITITSPINESTLSAQTIIKVDVADAGEIVSVTFLVNGDDAFVDTASPYEYDWDICTLEDATHTLLAKATDKAGNTGQSELFTFTINADYDCANECGGILANDECGECGGSGILDNCNVCDSDATNDCVQDCAGVWGGNQEYDDCGICDGDNSSCTDCNDIVNGDAVEDNCGTCDSDASNDCVQDCNDVWGGTAEFDECGTCDSESLCNEGVVELWCNCYNIESTTVGLNDNQLTGSIPPEIGNLTHLDWLFLDDNQLNGEIPPEIGNLTHLSYLRLDNNQLTGSIPPEIGNLTNLMWLHLNDNQLTGDIPQEVCNLIQNNNLDINDIINGNNLTNTCE